MIWSASCMEMKIVIVPPQAWFMKWKRARFLGAEVSLPWVQMESIYRLQCPQSSGFCLLKFWTYDLWSVLTSIHLLLDDCLPVDSFQFFSFYCSAVLLQRQGINERTVQKWWIQRILINWKLSTGRQSSRSKWILVNTDQRSYVQNFRRQNPEGWGHCNR